MPSALIVVITGALVAIHLRASFRASVAALLATTFLVPGALPIPGAPPTMYVGRVALYTAAIGLVIRATRGELPAWAIRPTRVFAALSAFVVLAYVLGVARGAYPSRPEIAFDLWLPILDQLLFLWVATAAVRVLGAKKVAGFAVTAVVASAVIAIGEKYTGSSYARFWFEHSPNNLVSALPLELRGTEKRVRASADFALEYAWVLAYFMPLVALFAVRSRRKLALVAPTIVAVALVFTVTRSAYAGLAIGAVLMALTARGDRRILVGLGAAALVAAVLYLGTSAVRQPYQSADPESEKVRARRLVLVTQELAPKPWIGTGLDGLIQRGIKGTDSAVLGTYGTLGVVGVAALGGAVIAGLLTASYGAVRGDKELAPLTGAVLGGLGAATLGMFAFDTFSAPISSWSLWLLAALSVGLYEEVRVRNGTAVPRPIVWNPARLALPAAGLVAGVVVATFAPAHVAVEMRVFALSPQYLSVSKKPNDDYIGRILIDSICDMGTRAVGPKIKVDCFDPLNYGPGTGIVRLESTSRQVLRGALFTFTSAAHQLPNTRVTLARAPTKGTPTWARTAPLTGMLAGTEAALLLPVFRLRRRPGQQERLPAVE